MLLIIEALLLMSAALLQDHGDAVEGQIYPLDMALNSVDDQYKGCRDKMAYLVQTHFLKKGKSDFNVINAGKITKLTMDHLKAIGAYTGNDIYREFNMDTLKDRTKYKNWTYRWYPLHFLLTEAIQILKKTQNKCYSTFRGTKAEFDKNVWNTEVRFGSFTSSSLDRGVAQGFGRVSCFEIITCQGADVAQNSKINSEKEVLIPPYETFRVTSVRIRKYQKDLWCDTVYRLKSTGTRSHLNCALFNNYNKQN